MIFNIKKSQLVKINIGDTKVCHLHLGLAVSFIFHSVLVITGCRLLMNQKVEPNILVASVCVALWLPMMCGGDLHQCDPVNDTTWHHIVGPVMLIMRDSLMQNLCAAPDLVRLHPQGKTS